MFPRSMPRLGAAATVALAAALLLPIVGGWQAVRTRDALLIGAEQNTRTLSRSLAQHASRTIEAVDIVLSDVVERVGSSDRGDLSHYLEGRAALLEQSRSIVVTDASGTSIADPALPRKAVNVADRTYFLWHRAHTDATLSIGELVDSRVSGVPVIPLSRRINNADGSFKGIVVSALYPEYFEHFFRSLDNGTRGALALWNDSGTLLARFPAAPGQKGPARPVTMNSRDIPTERSTVVRSISPVDGVDRIVAIEHLDNYPLMVSAAVSVEDALAQWRHETAIEALVLAGVSLTLLLLAVGLERHRRAAARSERRSREANRLYRLLAENSSDLIVVRSRMSTKKSYVSPSSSQLVGWSPEEFAAFSAQDFVHPDDFIRVNRELGSLTAEQPTVTSRYRVKHKDGRDIWVDAVLQLADDELMGESFVFTLRDITARRNAAEAVRESEARFRLLADSSSDIIVRLGLDGIQRYVSPASTELLGYDPGELEGTSPSGFIHPDDVGQVTEAIRALRSGEREQACSTHRARHKGGHWVWLDVRFRLVRDKTTGEPTEIVCSVRDITGRKSLQEQVAASAELLKATLENMDQGLLVLASDGSVKISNTRAHTLLGMRSDGDPDTRSAEGHEGWKLDSESCNLLFVGGRSLTLGPVERHGGDGRILEVRQSPMPDGAALITVGDITHLKRAEAVAQEANRLLLMAAEVAHVGHWRLDIAAQSLSWSDEVYRIHGLKQGVFVPHIETAIDLYHEDDRADVERSVSEAINNRTNFEFTLRLVRPDGEVRHVMSRGRCEVDAASNTVIGIFGVIMDVTGLTRAQRQLGEKSAHLEATLDTMEQGLVKVAADGTVELANRRFAELFELSDSLLGQPNLRLSDIIGFVKNRGGVVKSIGGQTTPIDPMSFPFTHETYELTRPNGWVLEVRTVPLPSGGMVRTYSDITSRRHAENAVRDSEARYRMLADTTSDVITQLDLNLHRQYASPSCRALLGYEPEEMVGVDPWASIHPDEAAAVRDDAERLVAGLVTGDRTTTTYRLRHKDGRWVWVEASINLVRDPETGAAKSLICSLRDVTERQRVARHLERAKAAAENAARQKSEFVANMSHELRTPLTGILGLHDLLQADPTLGATQRRYLIMARDAGRALLGIVNDVLDFSKIEAGELKIDEVPFSLLELVESCEDLTVEAARAKSLELDIQVDGTPVMLLGDAARLKQILLNLLTNAIKFTDHGGVTLTARYNRQTARLRFDVTDTGIGIAEAKLPLMFRRFNQADTSITRRFGGTGLGLAICKRLTELMGGQIGVVSDPGQGSTFWFEIPAPEVFEATALPENPRFGRIRPRKILLAEDNLVNQEVIKAILETRGNHVTLVDNGAAAAAAAAIGASGFEVILMDLQMPIMDGLSASRAIRAAEQTDGRPRTPIIGLTANAMVEDVALCLAAGMDAHVAKPIDWAELFNTMEQVTSAPDPDTDVAATDEPDTVRPEVLNATKLEQLAALIGVDRVSTMLGAFVREIERRLVDLDAIDEKELAACVHTFVSLAGQFGFLELSQLCAKVEDETRRGTGQRLLGDLRLAAGRALTRAQTFTFDKAA